MSRRVTKLHFVLHTWRSESVNAGNCRGGYATAEALAALSSSSSRGSAIAPRVCVILCLYARRQT